MAESRRLPLQSPDDAATLARQIDALLDEGLDRYFAAHYEEAIHLWTRVLFLDRTHERARGYIERARTSMAELQRRSDELLQTSRDLLERGEIDAARSLLAEAIATNGDDVQTAALRVHLERLERARTPSDTAAASPLGARQDGSWLLRIAQPRAVRLTAAAAALLLGAVTIGFVLGSTGSGDATGAVATAAAGAGRPHVLSSSEVALVRARTAVSKGRLAEALRELDRVSADSPDRPAADQLRIEIQQLLMASVRSASVTSLTDPVRR
jgi:tetratricopeptide (TPR) repeat protein